MNNKLYPFLKVYVVTMGLVIQAELGVGIKGILGFIWRPNLEKFVKDSMQICIDLEASELLLILSTTS